MMLFFIIVIVILNRQPAFHESNQFWILCYLVEKIRRHVQNLKFEGNFHLRIQESITMNKIWKV